jgi:hypothetical protein
MRSFYYREIIPPDIERRNYILKKLAFIKRTKETQDIIKMMRRQLKATEGKILYYRCHKGNKMLIGDETTAKKKFLMSKDPRFLEVVMSKFRGLSRSTPLMVYKDRFIHSVDMIVRYPTVGGVMMAANYFDTEHKKLQRRRVLVPKYPKDKDPYIGIELEYACNLTHDQIAEKLIEAKLQNDVRIMNDGSIRCNEIYPYSVEFCILTKWSGLKDILNRLKPIIFDKPQNFSPNQTCGFHVHLDMRYDDQKRVFRNLVCMQDVLFNLAAEHRRENKYCVPVTTDDWDEVDEEAPHAHWDAISKYSYLKHETIEVRIHQSTLSLTKIEKWITLLKRIADYKGDGLELGTFDSEFQDLKEKIKIEPDLIKYIEERDQL